MSLSIHQIDEISQRQYRIILIFSYCDRSKLGIDRNKWRSKVLHRQRLIFHQLRHYWWGNILCTPLSKVHKAVDYWAFNWIFHGLEVFLSASRERHYPINSIKTNKLFQIAIFPDRVTVKFHSNFEESAKFEISSGDFIVKCLKFPLKKAELIKN